MMDSPALQAQSAHNKNPASNKVYESISRPAKPIKYPHFIIYYLKGILFFSVLTFICFILVIIQCVAQTLKLAHFPAYLSNNFKSRQNLEFWFLQQYKKVITITERAFGSLIVVLSGILAPGMELVLTGDYDLLIDTEKAILMANHQIYPDWFIIWSLARLAGRHGDLKIMLIAILQYLPIFGFGMSCFEFLFLEQKLAYDKSCIVKHMRRQKTVYRNFPLWLLIFPEGTLNTPNNRVKSRAFAKKAEISHDPEFVLLPKGTGLFMIADELKQHTEFLFDLTVGYSGLDKEDIPYEEYLFDKMFLCSYYPRKIHIHVKKYNLSQIPGLGESIPEKLLTPHPADSGTAFFDQATNSRRLLVSEWVKQRFLEKDALLHRFYFEKEFPGTSAAYGIRGNLNDWGLVLAIAASSYFLIPLFWQTLVVFFSLTYRFLSITMRLFISS